MPSTHVREHWRVCRLGPPVLGPEGLRRPWGHWSDGTRTPRLIGDPGNNEGWKTGGLIGPGSGLAFVWDKALRPAARFPQPNSSSQLGPRGALGGRLQEATCAAVGSGGKPGVDSPNCIRDPGHLDALRITPAHQGAAQGRDKNVAATPLPCPA